MFPRRTALLAVLLFFLLAIYIGLLAFVTGQILGNRLFYDEIAAVQEGLLVAFATGTAVGLWQKKSSSYWLLLLFWLGVSLRRFYAFATPYYVRSYDLEGHLSYIRYVATHWRIPPNASCWECFQPPLYYAGSAVWMTLGHSVHWSDPQVYLLLQIQSFLITAASLGVAILIGRRLFSQSTLQQALFASALAVCPPLIFFSSRISNDVPLQLFSFLWFWLLLRWWQTGRQRDWLLLAVVLGFAMLIKSSAVVLIVVSLICLVLRPGLARSSSARNFALFSLIIAVIGGWYFLYRFDVDQMPSLIGRTGQSTGLLIHPSFWDHLRFHPGWILLIPYANPFNDFTGRRFFLDYFFRTALLGEFSYGPLRLWLVRSYLASILLLLPYGALGIVQTIRKRMDYAVPLLVTAAIVFVVAFAYPIAYNYASNQDFRFSTILILPLLFFVLQGITVSSPLLRKIGFIFFGCSLGFMLTFVLSVLWPWPLPLP